MQKVNSQPYLNVKPRYLDTPMRAIYGPITPIRNGSILDLKNNFC